MPEALLTPLNDREPIELGATLFRKQILPLGEIAYKGRTLRFDRDYLAGLIRSFRRRPFDQVTFQFADADNKHTMDPRQFGGEIKGLELTKRGLDAIVDLTPEAADTIRKNKMLGVSARILESYHREADHKSFGNVVQHVLGTLDPRITGMGAWQEVALSEEYEDYDTVDATQEEVITLSDVATQGGPAGGTTSSEPTDESAGGETNDTTTQPEMIKADPPSQPQGVNVNVNVNDPQRREEREPAGTSKDPEPIMPLEDMEFDDSDISEGLRELTGAALSNEDDEEGSEVQLSNDAQERIQNLEIRLANESFRNEMRDLVEAGVPPAIIECARPILTLPRTPIIDLANGEDPIDVAQVVRNILAEAKGFIQLATEQGSSVVTREGQQDHEDAILATWRDM